MRSNAHPPPAPACALPPQYVPASVNSKPSLILFLAGLPQLQIPAKAEKAGRAEGGPAAVQHQQQQLEHQQQPVQRRVPSKPHREVRAPGGEAGEG